MACGFLGKRCRVRAADDDGHSATTEFAREVVGVKCGRRGRCDPDEVCRLIEAYRFNDLVGVGDDVLAGSQRCDERHGELRELDQAPATQPT